MKQFITILFALILAGCASTSISGKGGFKTQANIGELTLSLPNGVTLTMKDVNHSTPTRAGGSVVGTTTAGAASILGTYLMMP